MQNNFGLRRKRVCTKWSKTAIEHKYQQCVSQESQKGFSVLRDLVDTYHDLAKMGHAASMYRVHLLLEDGILFEGDQSAAALQWLKKSAAGGHNPARKKLIDTKMICIVKTKQQLSK